jgi:2'-5' RNA ligase
MTRPHRWFVAVLPPPATLDAIARLPRQEAPGVQWEPRERWHVTLRFLGPADGSEVSAALATVTLPGATAVLGPRVRPLGTRVVVAPVSGLDALAGAVVDATADLGRPPDPRPFSGHLTLARVRHGAACALVGADVVGSFEVHEVALVDSLTTRSGPSYEVVERFAAGR